MLEERGRGLELEVGRHRVVVPAALVVRVVEAELSPPPPLAREWIGGLGFSEGEIFVAVDLDTARPKPGAAVCAILDVPRQRHLLWALRIARSVGFVEASACERPADLPKDWPGWVKGARLVDSSCVGLLDVVEMTRDFER